MRKTVRGRMFWAAVLSAVVGGMCAARAATLNTVPFGKQMTVTFSGYEGKSALSSFPALVRLSATEENKFSYADCQHDGSDIRFADASGNELPHEIDTWNVEGESLIWVKVPVLSGTTTSVSMYYKANPTFLSAVTPSDVWSDFTAVYHFAEETTDIGTFQLDATSNGLDAEVPSDVSDKMVKNNQSGRLGSGFSLTDRTCYARVPACAELSALEGTVTASGWMKLDSHAATWGTVWTSKNDDLWHKSNEGVAVVFDGSFSKLHARGYQNQSAGATLEYSLQDSWHFVSCVYDNTDYYLYVDGVEVAHGEGKTAVKGSSAYPLLMGGRLNNYGSYQVCGVFDEFRFKTSADSADWVKAEYDTVNEDGFAVLGEAAAIDRGDALSVGLMSSVYGSDGALHVNGRVFVMGGETSVTILLEYGESDTFGSTVELDEPVTAAGEVEVVIPSVTPGSLYYYRLKAVGANSEAYSETGSCKVPAATVLSTVVSASSVNALATYKGVVGSKGQGTTTVTLYLGEDADHLEPVASKVIEQPGDFSLSYLTPADQVWFYAFRAQDVNGGDVVDSNWTEVKQISVTDASVYVWAGGKEGAFASAENWTTDSDSGYGYPSKGSTVAFTPGADVTMILGANTGVANLDINKDGLGLTIKATTPGIVFSANLPPLTATGMSLTYDSVKSNPNLLSIGGVSNTVVILNGANIWPGEIKTVGEYATLRIEGEGTDVGSNSVSFGGDGLSLLIDGGKFSCNNSVVVTGEDFFFRLAGKTGYWFARTDIQLNKPAVFEYSIPEGGFSATAYGKGVVGGNGNGSLKPLDTLTIRLADDSPIKSLGKSGAGTYELVNFSKYIANGGHIANTNNFNLANIKSGTGELVWAMGRYQPSDVNEERAGVLSLKYENRFGFVLIVR